MFRLNYEITLALLENIKRIYNLVRRLDFNKLIESGLIQHEGKGKNTYYKLRER